jgi:hypothetical protein
MRGHSDESDGGEVRGQRRERDWADELWRGMAVGAIGLLGYSALRERVPITLIGPVAYLVAGIPALFLFRYRSAERLPRLFLRFFLELCVVAVLNYLIVVFAKP